MTSCFHCGEPVPPGLNLAASIDACRHPVCCIGCLAAAEWIDGLGLADYYRLRDTPGSRVAAEADFEAWDRPGLARMHVRELQPDRAEVMVLVEGMRCAACAWLIERALSNAVGVHEVAVNAIVRRVRIVFDPRRTRLSVLLRSLGRLGYEPCPLDAASIDSARARESRAAMKRLAVAGLGTMQAMMYAVALYAGVFDGIDASVRDFFRWMDMLVAIPVVLYSARPFFEGARREWRARRLSMDTPIALAIAAIFAASVIATVSGRGEIYFDSVSMFVLFLLLGRFVEMQTRHRAGDGIDAIARLQPAFAERVRDERIERVGVHELEAGDRIRVAAGSAFPADGIVLGRHCHIDESLLTGESAPRVRAPGDMAVAGSIAIDGPVDIEVHRIGADTLLAGISRLMTRAGNLRPRLATIADAAAARFAVRVLAATALTAAVWMAIDPTRAFTSAVAVLVISCPCAFALAAPAALTRAVAVLARRGVLVVDADALERLAAADRFVFDKTGTLTQPSIDVGAITCTEGSPAHALALAAALEQGSLHPLAQAMRVAATGLELPAAMDRVHAAGGGVSGSVEGRALRLGRRSFVLDGHDVGDDDALILAGERGDIARFPLCERVDAGAMGVLAELRIGGVQCELLSGDHPARVSAAAARLGIARWTARATPESKLARVHSLRAEGHVVAMIGDGINDAPVLAGADVAISVGHGAALAHAASGILLVGGGIEGLSAARAIARDMLSTLKRNLRWTFVYNVAAVPLAAAGLIPPWLAALGMSASSLLVVASSMSIGRRRVMRLAADDRCGDGPAKVVAT